MLKGVVVPSEIEVLVLEVDGFVSASLVESPIAVWEEGNGPVPEGWVHDFESREDPEGIEINLLGHQQRATQDCGGSLVAVGENLR